MEEQANKKVLYRYDATYDEYCGLPDVKIHLSEYAVHRETKLCYVLREQRGYNKYKDRFILKTSTGKRYAYDTKEAAYHSFLMRCRRRNMLSQRTARIAKEVLLAAENDKEYLYLTPRNLK